MFSTLVKSIPPEIDFYLCGPAIFKSYFQLPMWGERNDCTLFVPANFSFAEFVDENLIKVLPPHLEVNFGLNLYGSTGLEIFQGNIWTSSVSFQTLKDEAAPKVSYDKLEYNLYYHSKEKFLATKKLNNALNKKITVKRAQILGPSFLDLEWYKDKFNLSPLEVNTSSEPETVLINSKSFYSKTSHFSF